MARTALVTGGGRGIGAAVARRLAEAGDRVAVAARSVDELWSVAEETGGIAVPMDVTDAEAVQAGVLSVQDALGPVEILVQAAGTAPSAPFLKTRAEDWQRALDVNLTGAFRVMQAVLPDMLEAGWGRIVNVASVAGLHGPAYTAAYAASKHGLLGLTRVVAREVAAKGVTVNAVCPGFVDTAITREAAKNIAGMSGRTEDEAREELAAFSPQRRIFDPEEVAHLVMSLIPDAARGINGQALVLDGGELA